MLKSVVQAIPTYVMSCFRLPDTLVSEINSLMARFWWGAKENERKIHWKSWDKMCEPKSKGGMGFTDLKVFNQALLAKQGWRLINNKDSILSKILKARYFKKTDFVSSNRGYDPSYTWRSLWGAKAILLDGLKWRVGDGESIRIWSGAWLPGDSASLVPTPNLNCDHDLRVADLIDKETSSWNDDTLQNIFMEDDIRLIKQIQISERSPKDSLYWWPAKNGEYSTKSGYWVGRFGHLRNRGSSSEEDELFWKSVWNIHGPPKLHHFVWKAASGAVAVKENLHKRHISQDPLCPACKDFPEFITHAIFDCVNVAVGWANSSLLSTLLDAPDGEPKDRLKWYAKKMSRDDFTRLTAIAWANWKARNDSVFNDNPVNIELTVTSFLKLLADFKEHSTKVHIPLTPNAVSSLPVWTPPNAGFVKINTDAGLLENGWIGLGMVVRDERGKALAVAVKRAQASDVLMAETLAGKWGVKVAAQLSFQRAILESDSLSLIQALQKKASSLAPIGLMIDDILSLSNKFMSFKVSHVKRVGNMVAHFVARLTPSSGEEQLYLNSFPQGVLSLVDFDCNH